MKTLLILILTTFILLSCQQEKTAMDLNRYIIETEVALKPGTTNKVLELFKATNPDLVSDQPDWIRASFSCVEEGIKESVEEGVEEINMIIVRAEWRNKESYLKFSNSEKFKNTMGQFSMYFEGRPKVTFTKVLFEM
ncbi:MAG: hypothetical protein ACI959_000778 [Limisphaerales bacterium]|jgi:hypothetical protein